jgi:hypothetical protein
MMPTESIPLAPLGAIDIHHAYDDLFASLCNRCRRFDIQSFAKAPEGMRGYKLESVEAEALKGCELCRLLYDCVKELPDGEWEDHQKKYVHMSLWQDNKRKVVGAQPEGLQVNRLKIWVGGLYVNETLRQPSMTMD